MKKFQILEDHCSKSLLLMVYKFSKKKNYIILSGQEIFKLIFLGISFSYIFSRRKYSEEKILPPEGDSILAVSVPFSLLYHVEN